MRIGWIEPEPSYGGGSETIALDLARELAGRRHEVFVVHDTDGPLLDAYRPFAAGYFRTRLSRFGWRRLRTCARDAWALRRFAASRQLDCYFSSSMHCLGVLGCLRVMSGVPVVMHLGLPFQNWLASSRWAARWISAGVAPSNLPAATWRQAGWPAHRLHIVPNWVNRKHAAELPARNEARRRLGLPADRSIVLFLGRIVPEKGIHTLVRSLARLNAPGSSSMLLCVGRFETFYEPIVQDLVRDLRIPDGSVIFPGATNDSWSYLRAADLLVLPSEWEEPFGLTPLEAIAAGTLPIVSSAGFLPEIVGPDHADLVFPKGDDAALAALMARWLPPSAEKKARIQSLRRRIDEHFSAEKGVDAYEKILSAACVNRREAATV